MAFNAADEAIDFIAKTMPGILPSLEALLQRLLDLETENGQLRKALEAAEPRVLGFERSRAYEDGYTFCDLCMAYVLTGGETKPFPHKPECPFAVLLKGADAGQAREGRVAMEWSR